MSDERSIAEIFGFKEPSPEVKKSTEEAMKQHYEDKYGYHYMTQVKELRSSVGWNDLQTKINDWLNKMDYEHNGMHSYDKDGYTVDLFTVDDIKFIDAASAVIAFIIYKTYVRDNRPNPGSIDAIEESE